jgi:hypothetical protein
MHSPSPTVQPAAFRCIFSAVSPWHPAISLEPGARHLDSITSAAKVIKNWLDSGLWRQQNLTQPQDVASAFLIAQ